MNLRIGVLLCAVLLASAARAEWQDAGVPGLPRDVQVWRPGEYSVATGSGAWLFQADGGTQLVTGDSFGTYVTPQGCLVSLRPLGELTGAAGCPELSPEAGSIFGADSFNLQRIRHDEVGVGYAVGRTGGGEWTLVQSETGASTVPWNLLEYGGLFEVGRSLGVVYFGGSSHALFGDVNRPRFLWFRDQTLAGVHEEPFGSSVLAPTTIDLFNGGGSNPSAVFGTNSGLYRMELGSGLPTPISPVQFPGGPAMVASVDVNTGVGGPRADGFGMALLQVAGGSVVLSAVPTNDPARVGTEWRVNPTFPSGIPGYEGAKLQQVSCSGAEFCVIMVERSDSGNLLIYRNAHAPEFSVPSELSLEEGTTVTRFVPVSDGDGDALLVAAQGFSEGPLSVSSSPADGGVDLRLTTNAVCEDTTIGRRVELFASDGLPSHERDAGFSVTVRHTVPPGTPGVSPSVIDVPAGTGPKVLQATPGPGCAPLSFAWQPVGSARPLQASGGDTATFPTPEVICQEERNVYEVRASDTAGSSDAGVFEVVLKPYGVPSAAFAQGAVKRLTAGQPEGKVVPDGFHVCAPQPGPGFPMKTVWALAPGGPSPVPGVTVRTATGEEVSSASGPMSSPSLAIESERCIDTSVSLTAYHEMTDGTGLRGPESTVKVEVQSEPLEPLSSGTLVLRSTSTDFTKAVGTVEVEGLNCLSRRSLRAEVRLARQDGEQLGASLSVLPGQEWSFPLEQGCAGGTFDISGQLVQEGSDELGPTASVSVTVPRLDAALGPLAEPALVARCGEGARGTLVQTIPADACPVVSVSWSQVAGPTLAAATFSGTQLDVATQETGLDGLVGRRVVFRVTADGGRDNVATRDHEVPITVAPFVDVSHEMEKPNGSESGLLGLSVDLRNTTACGVTEVTLEERLEGMTYVPGSARLDGQPVEVEVSGDVLRARGLSLAGSATRRFTYVARPGLLGTPRAQAQVFLREVPISAGLQPVPPADSGCGCTSGGSGATAFGLVALGMLAARRRRATGRS